MQQLSSRSTSSVHFLRKLLVLLFITSDPLGPGAVSNMLPVLTPFVADTAARSASDLSWPSVWERLEAKKAGHGLGFDLGAFLS